MALRRYLGRRRRNETPPTSNPPIYIYPGLLRTVPARAVLLDALCPAAPYGAATADPSPHADDNDPHSRNDDGNTADCCPICFDEFEQNSLVRTLYCTHQYHSQCLLAWLLKGYAARCPICSASLSLPVECVSETKDPKHSITTTACAARALIRTPPAGRQGDAMSAPFGQRDLALSMATPIVHLPESGSGIQTLCAIPPGELDGEFHSRSYCYMEHDFTRFNKNLAP